MSTPTYESRKAHGLCPRCTGTPLPARVYCAECLQTGQRRYREHCEKSYETPGPQLLFCCGGSHVINMIPFTAPCCGKVYFLESFI